MPDASCLYPAARPGPCFEPVARAGALGAGERFISLLATLPLTPTAGTRAVGAGGWASEAVPGWTSAAHPYMLADGSAIYSESQAYCAVLFLSGLAAATPGALVVEMGTLVGHSSRCLGAGLGANATGPRGNGLLYAAFDSFTSFPAGGIRKLGGAAHPMAAAHAQHGPDKPYHRYIWADMMVRPAYAGPLVARPGYIEKTAPAFFAALPAGVPVEVFSIDSAKSHSQFVAQAAHVWPRLRVGSVLHLLDNLKHQLFFFFAQFVEPGDAEVAWISFTSSCWSFVVRRPLPWSRVLEWRPEALTAETRSRLHAGIDALVAKHAASHGVPQERLDWLLAFVDRKAAGRGVY